MRKDNLTYKEVKQCIQSFVFGVNTPSRWGCVKDTTKVLTPSGWKGVDELQTGDVIYTWLDGTLHQAPLKHIIHHKNDYGVLHQYSGVSYRQTVSPEHRCLVENGATRGMYIVKQSMDIFGKRKDLRMPTCIKDADVGYEDNLSDAEVKLAAIYYTDGSSDLNDMTMFKSSKRDDGTIPDTLSELNLKFTKNPYEKDSNICNRYRISAQHREYISDLIGGRRDRIDDKFLHLSQEQSELFIRTWAAFDGSINGRLMLQYDNDDIREKLEHIMIRAGHMPHKWSRKKPGDKNPTNYLYAEAKASVVITERKEIHYAGMVWCPNQDDGTAIYKDEDGNIFISGNCQAPFTNITLDWVCPDDMKNMPAIVGGKEQDFTYGDCIKEMAMVNKAFIEVMIEGDANGRGFQYPIPTYSITRDFDWSPSENNKLLFEMTSKYGTPYFSNYINSDMEPSDVRAMCPLRGDQKVLVADTADGPTRVAPIQSLYDPERPNKQYYILFNGQLKAAALHQFNNLSFLNVRTTNGAEVVMSTNHLNLINFNGNTDVVTADLLTTDHYLPFDKSFAQPDNNDTCIVDDHFVWFRIESIEPVTGGSAIGYCFEVLNDEEPYFMLPSGLVTHNCRLRLDLRELRKKSGGYFGAGESTGSVGVVTLNLPRLAYLSANETEFYQRLSRLMDIAARSLDIKRRVITKLMEEGLYPYTKAYLGSFNNHFSTIGLVGMNEACLNAKWIHTTIAEPAGHKFAEEVLDFMRNRLSDYQEQYEGALFNLEATPAESTAYRLAKHDIAKYPDIITAAAPGQTAYYTNSSQLPVGYTDDIFDALDLQDNLQTKYTSGTVFHAFLGEHLPNWQAAAHLVRKIAENYALPYYTLSPTYSICAEHGYLPGDQYKCPFCGKETEVYSRITGYYRPLKNWNDGKVQEFQNRLEYDQHKAGVPEAGAAPCEAMCETCQIEPPADSSEQVPESVAAEMPILVATETCPNCRMAARFLDEAGIAFTKVYASQRPDLIETYGIRTAPTLLVPDHGQMKAIINASNIRAYAEANRNP